MDRQRYTLPLAVLALFSSTTSACTSSSSSSMVLCRSQCRAQVVVCQLLGR